MKFSDVVKPRFSLGERKAINRGIEERLGSNYDLIFYLEDAKERADYGNHLVVLPKGIAYIKKNVILAYDPTTQVLDHPQCPGTPNMRLECELERGEEIDIAYRTFDAEFREAANLLVIVPHFPSFKNYALTSYESGIRKIDFLKEGEPRGDFIVVDGKKHSLDE